MIYVRIFVILSAVSLTEWNSNHPCLAKWFFLVWNILWFEIFISLLRIGVTQHICNHRRPVTKFNKKNSSSTLSWTLYPNGLDIFLVVLFELTYIKYFQTISRKKDETIDIYDFDPNSLKALENYWNNTEMLMHLKTFSFQIQFHSLGHLVYLIAKNMDLSLFSIIYLQNFF